MRYKSNISKYINRVCFTNVSKLSRRRAATVTTYSHFHSEPQAQAPMMNLSQQLTGVPQKHPFHFSPAPSSYAQVLNNTEDEGEIKQHRRAEVSETNLKKKKTQVEIKDPEIIFRTVIRNLERKHGEQMLNFPKDIMWLAGAPGAGKGVMTPFVMKHRGITAPPLEVSALLTTPEAMKLKESGQLVGDRQVIELLFDALLRPEYQSGVLVDGFPRTGIQAECIKMLYDFMMDLRNKHAGDSNNAWRFRRPIFHITVLYVEKQEAVERQLARGRAVEVHNAMVEQTGVGRLQSIRPTDVDAELAGERYRQFTDQVYDSLKLIKEKFHFHFINAEGSREEVKERIKKELIYQSDMELGDDTFEAIRVVPLASDIILHARHELVRRLDLYESRSPGLFSEVIYVVTTEFMNIIRRQALAGKAVIRSDNALFAKKGALDMALDVLSERGYTTVLDLKKQRVPISVDLKTGAVKTKTKRLYEFAIEFPKPKIRRG